MSEIVSMARSARENLARALQALQAPGVPEQLLTVAEPVAAAMRALHQIESSGGAMLVEQAPRALEAVREALGLLQREDTDHPAVQDATAVVAGSLGLVHTLARTAQQAAPAPAPIPQQNWPQAAPTVPAAQPAEAAWPPAPPAQPAWVQQAAPRPAPRTSQGPVAQAPQQVWPPQAPQAAAQPWQPQPAQPAPQAPAQQAWPPQPSQTAAQPPAWPPQPAPQPLAQQAWPQQAPQPAAQPPAQQAWPQQAPQPAAQPPAQPPWNQPRQASAQHAPGAPERGEPIRMDAELGAHSATNFYKGLSGNDVIESGGIFIATYKIPELGQPLLLRVSLPGGYEFEARGVVRWTRDVQGAGSDTHPGFGAQFTEISAEGRQLVYRYVRNREPLFHDDL